MKFAVSSDSTCDLKKEYRNQRDIWFAPLTFTMEKDGVMEEGLDYFSSNEEYLGFYRKVKSGYFPRTSKLNHEAHEVHFTKLAKAGVKEVLHFSISSGLADTVTVAQSAADGIVCGSACGMPVFSEQANMPNCPLGNFVDTGGRISL